jgi:ribosomal protein S12 methylthiotransferase accessory factor
MDYKSDPATRLVNFISIGIKLPGSFPEKYIDAVVNAADLCKVKRHLSEKIQTEVTVIR